jgi:hypothetical protein
MIKFLRAFIIFTSVCCILLYLLIDSKSMLGTNVLFIFLDYYTFFTWFMLYPLLAFMLLRGLYQFLRKKNIQEIYFLLPDVGLPILGLWVFHLYYVKVFM